MNKIIWKIFLDEIALKITEFKEIINSTRGICIYYVE
jgi:hypothetical protein